MLGIDEEICRIFGREREHLRKAGHLIGDFDLFIAATGLHYGLTVLTNNRQPFAGVEGLQIDSISPQRDLPLHQNRITRSGFP